MLDANRDRVVLMGIEDAASFIQYPESSIQYL
jgi:hypothetical protein